MRLENFAAFEKHLERGPSHLSSLYLFVGKDFFECEEAIQLLFTHFFPSSPMRDWGLSIFKGGEGDEKELHSSLNTNPLFASKEVIWIQQAEKLTKQTLENLEKIFKKEKFAKVIVMSASSWNKNTLFYKAVDQHGIILDFEEVKPWEREKYLLNWINKKAKDSGKNIAPSASLYLLKQMNFDRALLDQELEKLFCYCLNKKDIALKDTQNVCFAQPAESIWQWGEAIFRRDAAAALQIGVTLLSQGQQPLLPLLRQLRSQFQTDYQVGLMLAQGKLPQDIQQQFPYMKGQILDKHAAQAKMYGLESFKRGLLHIDATELQIKNSSINEKILLELLIIHLTKK